MSNTRRTIQDMSVDEIKRHVFAFYEDSEECSIIVRAYGLGRAVPLSSDSGAKIKNAMFADEMVEDSDGYDEDPTAFIYYLHPNQYVQLLNKAEQDAVSQAHWDMRVEFYGSVEKALNPRGGRVVNGRLGRPRSW